MHDSRPAGLHNGVMRMLITAGPTQEYFDSVRFLSNPSSGRMGFAIARAAVRRGHEVVLLAGPVSLRDPIGVQRIDVTSAEEMRRAAIREFRDCDAAVMTAAVCDYRPVRREAHKAPKRRAGFSLRLEPTTDVCARLGHSKGRRVVVGFALEDHDAREHAEAKLRAKGCDAIVLNGPGTVGSIRANIEILTADGVWTGPFQGTKSAIASRLVRLVENLLTRRRNGYTSATR